MNQVPIQNKAFQQPYLIPWPKISAEQEERILAIRDLPKEPRDGRILLTKQNLMACGLISEAQVAQSLDAIEALEEGRLVTS